MSLINGILFRKDTENKYKLMICDDRSPGEILLDSDYLRKFDPTIESINDTKSLVLNLRSEEQINKLCDFCSRHNKAIQIIKDSSFIDGINGFVYFI